MRVEKLGGLVARLHAHPRRRLTLLVGVDGPPGSGKTTLAAALASLDPGIEQVEMDGFRIVPGETSDEEVAPGLDWRRLRNHVLLPLSRDVPGRYQALHQETASPGDIVAALVDGEATVKRFARDRDAVVLRPEHPTMKPIVVGPDRPDFRVLGKVIGVLRSL